MKLVDTVSPSASGSNAAPVVSLPGAARPSGSPPPPVQAAPVLAPTPRQPPSDEATRQAARMINDFLKSSSAGIEFSVDDGSNRIVVRVVDSETKQVIRQMPSEEALAIAQSLDRLTGLLLAQDA